MEYRVEMFLGTGNKKAMEAVGPKLTELAKDGWEPVSTAASNYLIVVLRRPIPS